MQADLLLVGNKIAKVGRIDRSWLTGCPLEVELLDCSGLRISPGLIDPHLHLSGGSGEGGGFFSQSPQILVSECIRGGITTVVGTLGVDTTTKTMGDLLAKVKAYNEIGLTAFCYLGGYDVPPKTLTGSVRDDIIFIKEIIGVGEVAIADRRAPEPSVQDLARISVDSYVGGMLTGKAGVTHFHVGEAERRLKTVRDLMEAHTILPEKIYLTHIERSEALVREGVDLSKKGCFIDFDIHERDLHKWYKFYLDAGGKKSQLTVSSDAGVSSPSEIWAEITSCVESHNIQLKDLLPHFTSNTATALSLDKKGRLEEGADADLIAFKKKDMELTHVVAGGKFFLRDGFCSFENRAKNSRRGLNIYEIG